MARFLIRSRSARRATLTLLAAALCAVAGSATPSDAQVRAAIVRNSIAAYDGNCPCPYHLDRAGRACGRRSAWNRPGGEAPLCYVREVTDRQVQEFRVQRLLTRQVPP